MYESEVQSNEQQIAGVLRSATYNFSGQCGKCVRFFASLLCFICKHVLEPSATIIKFLYRKNMPQNKMFISSNFLNSDFFKKRTI